MRERAILLQSIVCLACVAFAGCGDDTSNSPTSPTTTSVTAAEPTVTETFTGTLQVNSARFYAFEVGVYGTVNITLQNVGGVTGVPDSVWVGVGVGVPDGTDCSTTASTNTQAGSSPQVTSVLDAGTYCARIYDIGNLAAPTAFSMAIAHP